MNETLGHLITVRIAPGEDGNFVGKSEDLPGLLLVYPTREQILEDIPEAVKILYQAQFGEEVEVVVLDSAADPPELKKDRVPVAAIPVHFFGARAPRPETHG